MRVWNKTQNAPGLAMSRSFGDKMAEDVGVTAEPEIFTTKLGKESRFLLVASDGVWEYLTNEEVLSLVFTLFSVFKSLNLTIKKEILRELVML